MPSYLRSPEQSTQQDLNQAPALDKGKAKDITKDKDKGKETTKDDMAPKSGYYDSSRSSSEGDRVHYDPRKERRSVPKPSTTKRPPAVVHNHHTSSSDPKRPAQSDASRWK